MPEPLDPFEARFSTLRAISRNLARPLELIDALRSIAAELARVLDVTMCFFGLYDAPAQSVHVIWQVHQGVELPGGHFPLGAGFTSQVIRDRQPLLIRDWSSQVRSVQVQYATDRPGLPRSSITVPALFDEQVIGVLSIQSYEPEAFDKHDLALVQAAADQVAAVIGASGQVGSLPEPADRSSDLEAVVAGLADGLLLVDQDARVLRLNQAARTLLCLGDDSVILGWPADEPQSGQWPLGSQNVTEAVRPILSAIRRGETPPAEVTLAVPPRSIKCSGSLLRYEDRPRGGVLIFHQVLPVHALSGVQR